jgi:hypothetical protein
LLRSWEDMGYLVPASLAVRPAPPQRPTARESLGRARMVASSAWTPTERLWETFLLAEWLAAAARGAARRSGLGRNGAVRDAQAWELPASDRRAGRAG